LLTLGLLSLPCVAADMDAGLRQAVERVIYRMNASGRGVYTADNPAQHLTVTFDARQTTLTHGQGSVAVR